MHLRTDRSGGEPIARRADVSWCFIQCCAASRRTRGFVDPQEARDFGDWGRADVQSHACWRFVWVMGATEAEDARSWVEAGGGAGGERGGSRRAVNPRSCCRLALAPCLCTSVLTARRQPQNTPQTRLKRGRRGRNVKMCSLIKSDAFEST